MKVKIYGESPEATELTVKIKMTLDELGLIDFVEVGNTQEKELEAKLGITKIPALIIEEESIDFQDMIFEGIIPSSEELKSMFISIVGGSSEGCGSGSCGTGEEGSSCGIGCGCH